MDMARQCLLVAENKLELLAEILRDELEVH